MTNMKNVLLLLCLLSATILCSTVKAQTVKELNTEEFKNSIWNFEKNKEWKYSGDKPAIIDLYATWCGPCKRLAPILAEIQKDYGNKIQIYKVDTDKETALARLFNVRSIPLMVFIPKKSEPFLVSGLRPKEQLVQIINEKLLTATPVNSSGKK